MTILASIIIYLGFGFMAMIFFQTWRHGKRTDPTLAFLCFLIAVSMILLCAGVQMGVVK